MVNVAREIIIHFCAGAGDGLLSNKHEEHLGQQTEVQDHVLKQLGPFTPIIPHHLLEGTKEMVSH